MLKLFQVRGFKNFKNLFTLDFSDVRDYRFNCQCINNSLVTKAIIYGKNSVGKTNFGLAIFDIVKHLSSKYVTPNFYDYYLNADEPDNYAEFHYVFVFGQDELDYVYRKNDKQSLVFEQLKINNELVFKYDYLKQEGDFAGIRQLAPTLVLSFKDIDSVLRYIINNTILPKDHSLRKMADFVDNMLWFRSLDENRYIGYKNSSSDFYDFMFDDSVLREFESLLQDSGIDEKLVVKKDNDGKHRLYFDTKESLPFFRVASNGTKALYTFYYWYKTAHDVSLLFIDEFDAFYHYELAESVVKMLQKLKNTQVILTSHNTNLLTNRIMRPDCYFILTKNTLTSFANATDRELREGHNLEKLYMSGEFNEQ